MHIDRRTLTVGAAAHGAGVSAEDAESNAFDEGVAVQRVYDANGELVSVDASAAAGAAWVTLLARE